MNVFKISASVFFSSMAAILVTGLMLDEMGKGTFGDAAKNIAIKTTKGYGV